jgi:hypothetical protein
MRKVQGEEQTWLRARYIPGEGPPPQLPRAVVRVDQAGTSMQSIDTLVRREDMRGELEQLSS